MTLYRFTDADIGRTITTGPARLMLACCHAASSDRTELRLTEDDRTRFSVSGPFEPKNYFDPLPHERRGDFSRFVYFDHHLTVANVPQGSVWYIELWRADDGDWEPPEDWPPPGGEPVLPRQKESA
jgi:hypothetical protein